MAETHDPVPAWLEAPPPGGSWRSLFKWGDPDRFKHPGAGFHRLLKRALAMEDADFRAPARAGLEPALPPGRGVPEGLAGPARAALEAMLGPENVQTDGWARVSAAYGKGMLDLLRLRRGIAEHLPAAVLHPRDRHDLMRIVEYCSRHRIPMTPRGGATSVTRGVECLAGGVALELRTHMNRILRFDAAGQTVTVEPGLLGPGLEQALDRAPERFGAAHRYTCGHFPQSFEFSCVGGWAATRGAGQNSTYFGKIEDLVLAQEIVTPTGVLRTCGHPAAATGPDTDQILLGSEGAFGVLSEVTLRVFRRLPGSPVRFSYLFPDWASGLAAVREVMQGQFGFPSVFRLSDPQETELALAHFGLDGALPDAVLAGLGLKRGACCLLLGSADGERGFARHVRRRIGQACRRQGALPATGLVTRAWERGRFLDPYVRDDLQDFGILIDTLECSVTWSGLERAWRGVRAACAARPRTLCLSHVSHCYPQGASLYFLVLARLDAMEEYLALQAGMLDAILEAGAAMSHHHGIGKLAGPWLEAQLGPAQMELFRAIKRHFDPENLMNPGGTLGLDRPAP